MILRAQLRAVTWHGIRRVSFYPANSFLSTGTSWLGWRDMASGVYVANMLNAPDSKQVTAVSLQVVTVSYTLELFR